MWTFLSLLLNDNKNNNNSSSSNNRIFDRFALSIIEWGQSATPWRTGWYYSLSSECLQSFTLSCGCTQYFYRLVYWYQGAPSGGRKVKAICSSLNGHLGMSWSRIKASRVSCDFMSRMLLKSCLPFCTWYKIYIHVFPDWLVVKEVSGCCWIKSMKLVSRPLRLGAYSSWSYIVAMMVIHSMQHFDNSVV